MSTKPEALSVGLDALVGQLRLMRAWFTPGGPTPDRKMPNKVKVLDAAVAAIQGADEAAQLWPHLIGAATRVGHKPEPGESEYDFLQRLVMRPNAN